MWTLRWALEIDFFCLPLSKPMKMRPPSAPHGSPGCLVTQMLHSPKLTELPFPTEAAGWGKGQISVSSSSLQCHLLSLSQRTRAQYLCASSFWFSLIYFLPYDLSLEDVVMAACLTASSPSSVSSPNPKECRGKGRALRHCWWEYKSVQPLWKLLWRFCKKLRTTVWFFWTSPGLYLKELKSAYHRDTCTPMCIAALFTITKLWNQPRCSSINDKEMEIYT
jgi:hypothetical protein